MTVSIGIHVIGLARLSRVSLGDSVEAHLRACRLASETYAMLHGRVQAARPLQPTNHTLPSVNCT